MLRLEMTQRALSKGRPSYLTGQVQLVATRRRPSGAVLCRSSIVQLCMQSKDLHSCPHVAHHKQALSHIHKSLDGLALLDWCQPSCYCCVSDSTHMSPFACLQGTKRNTLQLLAVCCLLLASKHEEVRIV